MKLSDDFREDNIENISIYQYIDVLVESYTTYQSEKIKELDITSKEAPFLIELQHNNNVSQQHLAWKFKFTEGYTAKVIRNLEDDGYITRRENPENRRKKIVTLTDEGNKISQYLVDTITSWEKLITRTQNPEKTRAMKKELFRLSKESEKI